MEGKAAYIAKPEDPQDLIAWMHEQIERYAEELRAGKKMTFVFHLGPDKNLARFELYDK